MTPESFGSGFWSAEHLNERIHFPKCSQQLCPGQTVRKAQHMLIFGAHVRTQIYLGPFWNHGAALWASHGTQLPSWSKLQVLNRFVGLWTLSVMYFFIICASKSNICLWFDTNSCDSAFKNHHDHPSLHQTAQLCAPSLVRTREVVAWGKE